MIVAGSLFLTTVSAWADIYYFKDEAGQIYYTNVPSEGRTKVRMPFRKASAHKTKNMPEFPLIKVSGDSSANYDPVIIAAARHYSVDSNLIRAVIKAESNYNPRAVSPKGAMGLMQLMPATAREMSVADPLDPTENIYGGVRYLGQLFEVLNGDLQLVLAAYNAGPTLVMNKKRIPAIAETQYYVKRVLRHYRSLQGEKGI